MAKVATKTKAKTSTTVPKKRGRKPKVATTTVVETPVVEPIVVEEVPVVETPVVSETASKTSLYVLLALAAGYVGLLAFIFH